MGNDQIIIKSVLIYQFSYPLIVDWLTRKMMELSLIIDRKNKVKILERFDKTEKDLEEDVELIQDWFKSQPHLPEIPSKYFFALYNKDPSNFNTLCPKFESLSCLISEIQSRLYREYFR